MAGPGYGAPIPQITNYAPQYGYPPQQYPQQYQQPQPQQQYQPPPPQQPMDPLADIIHSQKEKLSELKRLNRAKQRAEQNVLRGGQHQAPMRQADDSGVLTFGEANAPSEEDSLYDHYSNMEPEELEKMQLRVRKGTREYQVISELLEDAQLAEQELDIEDLGAELNQLEFYGVRVWEESGEGWITAEPRISVDDTASLLDRIRKKFPFATKVRWGKVKKDGREIPNLSDKVFALQSAETARLAISKAQRADGDSQRQFAPQQQHHQQTSGIADLAPLLDAMNRDRSETQKMFFELMKTLKEDKQPEKDPLDNMLKMKELFVTPMLDSIKAMQPKGGNGIDPFAMVNTMLGGAKQLASMSGGGGGSGESGILQTIMQYAAPFLQQLQQNMQQGQNGQPPQLIPNPQQPSLFQRGQQRQTQQQLPAPQQQRPQVENPAVGLLRKKCKKIIDNMLAGKLELQDVPRYIWRNGVQEEGQLLMTMDFQQFATLLKSSVNMKDPTLAAFINSPKTKLGVQWIFEEFHRLATFIGICMKNGDEELAQKATSWESGPLIETTLVGQQATAEFIKRYEITQADLAGVNEDAEDLPSDEAEDLPAEESGNGESEPVAEVVVKPTNPSGGPARSGSPTSAKVDEPSSPTGTVSQTPQRPQRERVKAVLVGKREAEIPAPQYNPRPRKIKARPSFLKKG